MQQRVEVLCRDALPEKPVYVRGMPRWFELPQWKRADLLWVQRPGLRGLPA
jgi:hypothetical protein